MLFGNNKQSDDTDGETYAELALEAHYVIGTVGSALLEFAHYLDELGHVRSDLEARGDEPFDPGVTYGKTVQDVGDSIARELSRLTGELREILALLNTS